MGEFFKDKEWYSIVKNTSSIILKGKNDDGENPILAEQLIEYVYRSKKYFGNKMESTC